MMFHFVVLHFHAGFQSAALRQTNPLKTIFSRQQISEFILRHRRVVLSIACEAESSTFRFRARPAVKALRLRPS